MRHSILSLALVSLWGLAATAADVAPLSRAGVETNEAGQLLRAVGGRRITYTESQWAELDPPAAPEARVEAAAVAHATASASAVPELALDPVWNHYIWGTSIGRSGMEPVDLDGDGRLEIVLGASAGGFGANAAWRIARRNAVNGQYELVWSSPPYSNASIGRLAVYTVGGRKRVYVGLSDGRLLAYAGDTRELERETQLSGGVRALAFADADNDGAPELVVTSDASTALLDPETLALQRTLAYGGQDVAVGNVDADTHLELVLSSGSVIDVDGAAVNVKWNFSSFGAGAYLGLSDIDGDGMQEIVSARNWYYIDIFDADLRSPKSQIRTDLDIHALLLVDVTGDGRDEILYGDAQWGEIHAIDALTRAQLWQVPNPEHGITRIAVADVDADGERELMWAGGWTSTGADYFFVAGLASRAIEWQSEDLVGPFAAVAVGDVDGDGGDEIVAISWSSESDYADGVLHVFDAHTFQLEWQSSTSLFGRYAWTGVHDVEIGDVDRDGQAEIVVGTDRLYDGALYVIDGKTHAMERQIFLDDGSPIYAIALADMDGDGGLEIVAGGGRAHTGSPGTFVYVIDGASGLTEWTSVNLGNTWNNVYAVEVADLNADDQPDIVAALDSVYVIDGALRSLRKSGAMGARGLDVSDADGDGAPEIWTGNASGSLVRIADTDTLSGELVDGVCGGPINSVRIDRASSLSGSLQFACDREIGVYGLFEGEVLWRSPELGGFTGGSNNLQVEDRGDQALLIAGHGNGVSAFQGFGTRNTDVDEDGVPNHLDTCPEVSDPEQADADGDGVGDACNDASDADGDEWANGRDNCRDLANPSQADADANGLGDACNEAEDADGDEWADALDNCATQANGDQSNRDGDELGDACDPYPDNPDNYAARCEEAIGNELRLEAELAACLAQPLAKDADGDGEADATDACPDTPAGGAVDTAGCSRSQFCGGFAGSGLPSALRCLASDWRNDEPGALLPVDCTFTREGWFAFGCVAY